MHSILEIIKKSYGYNGWMSRFYQESLCSLQNRGDHSIPGQVVYLLEEIRLVAPQHLDGGVGKEI